jgi:RHS repeat-associated protein
VSTYAYDGNSQLLQAGSQTYSYDLNGNPTGSGQVIGANNQLSSTGTDTYTYDANGNLIQDVTSVGDTWTYTYNAANEQTSAVETDADNTVLASVSDTYDVFGNRIAETDTLGGTTTTKMVYTPDGTLYADLNSTGTVQTRYLAGNGPNDWMARVDSSGVEWLLTDHLGSIRDVVNNAGTVLDAISYDAFGNILSGETDAGARGRLGFQGGELQVITGAYHFGIREYNPQTQRWNRVDPIGWASGQSNLYQFVGNSPTNATDPSGLAGNGLPSDLPSNSAKVGQWLINDAQRLGFKQNDLQTLGQYFNSLPQEGRKQLVSQYLGIQTKQVIANPGSQNEQYYTTYTADNQKSAFLASVIARANLKNGILPPPPPVVPPPELGPVVPPPPGSRVGKPRLAQPAQSITYRDLVALKFMLVDTGILTGAKAVYNGSASFLFETVGDTLNLFDYLVYGKQVRLHVYGEPTPPFRQRWGDWALNVGDKDDLIFPVTAEERQAGYGNAHVAGKVVAVLASLFIPGLGWSKACKAASLVGRVLTVTRVAKSSAQLIVGVDDIRQNGLTWENGLQTGAAALDLLLTGLSRFLRSCFAAGTPLLTPEGARAIEEIEVGDLVLARSEDNPEGPVEARVVEAVFVRTGRLLRLGVGGKIIGTSDEHPFWVVGKGWTTAAELAVGDDLVGVDGRRVSVEKVELTDEYVTLYNISVAEFHTYFVGCQEWGFNVWAHNTPSCTAAFETARSTNAARHSEWASNLTQIQNTMARLGMRALQQGGRNQNRAEAILNRYATLMNRRFRAVGSSKRAATELAAWNGSATATQRGTRAFRMNTAVPLAGTSRLDLAVYSTTMRGKPVLAGIDISYDYHKVFKLIQYRSAFGNIPMADVRLAVDLANAANPMKNYVMWFVSNANKYFVGQGNSFFPTMIRAGSRR